MKLDAEKAHNNNISHELEPEIKSDGGFKVNSVMEWEGKHDPLPQVEEEQQTDPLKHTYDDKTCNDKTEQTAIEDISYDKDVAEIKMPDVVVSSNYDAHFVKDVCVDEGFRSHQNILAENQVGVKASSNFDSSMGDLNVDMSKETGDESSETSLDLKSRVQDALAANETSEEHKKVATDLIGEIIQERLSLKELLSLESAADAKPTCTRSSDYSEDNKLPMDGPGIDPVSAKSSHEVGAVGSESSELTHDGFLDKASSGNGFSESINEHSIYGTLDMGLSKQSNWYNPFMIAGLSEDTLEYEQSLMLPIPYTTGEPIHDTWNMESLSTIANNTLEESSNAIEAARNPDAESSVQHIEQKESTSNELASNALEEKAAAASAFASSGAAKPNDANGEDHTSFTSNSVASTSEFNPGTVNISANGSMNNVESKNVSSVQNDPVVEETTPDSAKASSVRGASCNLVDLNFSGPSIISGPMSASGHISYPGSMSIRSDSSTTSTRSFAFPILQTEWHSSPVKMAKANHRRLRRHRGWRTGILCCKF